MKRTPTMFPLVESGHGLPPTMRPIGEINSVLMRRLENGRRELAAIAERNRKASLIAQEAIERAMETAGDK